jgi:acid stress chaperone HdeB
VNKLEPTGFLEAAVMSRTTLIILITLLATPAAHAQVTIDVSKITCDQYLGFSVADPKDINIWLNGYYHGKQGSTVFEPQRVKEIAEKLKAECLLKANSKLPMMQVLEKIKG